MIAGLLVMDPSLCLGGRLVGYVEMKKGPADQTALDIPPAFLNDVLRNKRVLVGCGGVPLGVPNNHSPVASWIEDTDVALNDEGQQYGDEALAIARAQRKCLDLWCGDHKQTPGGLRKTDEAKAFRRKLLRRPIALRGDTEHFQPNMLGKVVLRYLEGMDEPLINSIQIIPRATMGGMSVASAEGIATLQSSVFGSKLVTQFSVPKLSHYNVTTMVAKPNHTLQRVWRPISNLSNLSNLRTGIYPIPSAGSVHDDLFPFLHAFTPLITFWFNL